MVVLDINEYLSGSCCAFCCKCAIMHLLLWWQRVMQNNYEKSPSDSELFISLQGSVSITSWYVGGELLLDFISNVS